ncbi:E3 ubiquitin-protein ligase [Komagataella phaffii CBS 7435]|uniref:DNA binding protein with similarity to the S. pombe Snt2 protein n=2 Tax=Komagataella phaffii TaxID=460519 RepID=C4R001_KOMPG|nr:uncharacterized protein PAS_chr2-1_0215 [Komagataella phaffii GS115]AOA62410.1 GQ67_00245T0 [Komagataella phaffii]CAH2448674.1 E3 ubiquitin-protein ligase [Komagataella phaffii CBS 7435]AOA67519.1 GQ68_01143T0 [Komagataella phaffii GS115]CAY68825.1 DNA binding protein with similarity to the S. pombe Snt2 protein [Komagataella phaffii GS115]CCA38767.1 E3 ubiquitin-protein ligase [Komagataella phaffii CBS 7435]
MSSGARPKRSASLKVNYKEATEKEYDAMLHKSISKSPSKRQKKVTPPSTANTSETPNLDTANPSIYVPIDEEVPLNWQPPVKKQDRFNNVLDLEGAIISENTLILKNRQPISKGQCIYMISEPAGEPYYIGRILGFEKKENFTDNPQDAKNFMFKINWYYRPRDLVKRSTDSRLLYATMHTDNCPIQSYRGTVTIKHKSEIANLDEFKQTPNCFYFEKLFDRYMIKLYDVLPTKSLDHLPENYYRALNKRFEYVFVETGKAQTLLSAPKNCEKCYQWCSNMDSVHCLNCEKYYHMLCLDPPILSKPKRGFGWYCAKCSRDMEVELSERRGKLLEDSVDDDKDDEVEDDEKNEVERQSTPSSLPHYEEAAIQFLENDSTHSLEERRKLEEWPYRYLGVHAKLEDALDLQDRPYPRAASRLGAKHQCNYIPDWFGHPLKYYDKLDDDGKVVDSHKKKQRYFKSKSKVSPPPISVIEDANVLKVPDEYKGQTPDTYPPWLLPRPRGYIERGGDDTAVLMWRQPKDQSDMVESYIEKCSEVSDKLGLYRKTPNFMDAILKFLMDSNYDPIKAFEEVKKLTRDSVKEPTLTPEELEKFEAAVKKYGSELYPVYQAVGTQKCPDIVRFYYLWKKTPNGHRIWDNFEGRHKNKIKAAIKTTKGTPEDINDSGDDSAFDSKKIKAQRFECKYCHSNHSTQWFKVSGAEISENGSRIALCMRCARLWRRYGVVWEEPNEKPTPKAGAAWKKKIESELVRDNEAIIKAREMYRQHPRKIGSKRKADDYESPTTKQNGSVKRSKQDKEKNKTEQIKLESKKSEPKKADNKKAATKKTESKKVVTNPEQKQKVKRKKVEKKSPDPKLKGDSTKPLTKKSRSKDSTKQDKSSLATTTKVKANKEPKDSNKLLKIAPKKLPPQKQPLVSDKAIEEAKLPFAVSELASFLPWRKLFNRYASDYEISNLTLDTIKRIMKSIRPGNPIEDNKKVWKLLKSAQLPGLTSKNMSLPLYDLQSRPCSVCRTFDDINEMLICINCGLNVHASCYGMDTKIEGNSFQMESGYYNYKWCCDPCSNDLHPLISTYYSCMLCNAREIDHDACITGQPNAIPDCLKRTTSDDWAHVICALFTKGITFGNPAAMQPIQGVEAVLHKNTNLSCGICGVRGGGMADCHLCKKEMHLTCAVDVAGCMFGFLIDNSSDNRDAIKISDEVCGLPSQCLICNSHPISTLPKNFVPLRAHGTLLNQIGKPFVLVLSQFLKVSKSADSLQLHSKIIQREIAPDLTEKRIVLNPSPLFQNILNSVSPESKNNSVKLSCQRCNGIQSPIWYPYHEDSQAENNSKVECHSCHYGPQQNREIPNLKRFTERLDLSRLQIVND